MKKAVREYCIVKELSCERVGLGLAGFVMFLSVGLGYFAHHFFLLIAVCVGIDLTLSVITNRCEVEELMAFLGIPGEREIARRKLLRRE